MTYQQTAYLPTQYPTYSRSSKRSKALCKISRLCSQQVFTSSTKNNIGQAASAMPSAQISSISTPLVETTPNQQQQQQEKSLSNWPVKSDIYLVRSDGHSCSREIVRGSGKLTFEYPSTHQHLLVWKTRPQTVAVLKKQGQELVDYALEIIQFLGQEEGMRVVVEPELYAYIQDLPGYDYVYTFSESDCLAEMVDFVVCLGGDGVILHASNLFRSSTPPIIAFNLGSLGFLTNHQYSDFRQDIKDVIYGCEAPSECNFDGSMKGIHIALRMRLQCDVYKRGEIQSTYNVLNEVVIDRGSAPFLSNVEVYEKGKYVTNVQADGVMLATPTGSTAYSVAAGGSMVHPNVPAILFTPICPHSLSFRPIVLPDYADVELKVPDNARCTAWASFDGKNRQELERGDWLRVRMSQRPVPTINKTDLTNDWINSLERCFGWNNRLIQKPLS
eukprot:TRINITY_DN2505_c0_g3_i1.p1 TRINITY_DN2505_c0_g3~~TRINITY_DN2505_c0_g3_i1.p1  ORF type:complete len:444 (-),score=36.19 TRINITY_DN2505_c0_g3_i1:515-1846(-)